MSLSTQLISGSVQALNLIKNYVANPRISTDSTGGSFGSPVPNPLTTVVLLGASFHEIGDDDISSQLVISETTGDKAWITDNIAPKPRVWELKGYIGPSDGVAFLNVVNGLFVGELATPLLQDDLNKSKRLLRDMRTSRQMLVFQTPNGEELVWVGMKHLDFEKDPLVQNQIPVTMTLQEIPILQFSVGSSVGIPSGSSNLAADAVTVGTTQGLQIANSAAAIGGFF